MFGLSLRSLRFRAGGFAASFLTMFLGATILMAFASMLDTSAGAHVDADSEETLGIMATVVGGWGLIIVAFGVASTLALSVRQRNREMALLKAIGATPTQIRRMIVGEAAVLAVVAAVAAIPPAILGGALLLEVLKDTDQVALAVEYSFGPTAIGIGLGITFVASTIAALVAARRATKTRASEALVEAAIDRAPLSRKRLITAWLFLALGLGAAVVTATVFNGEGIDAMQSGGQASILTAIGLALLAPALVRKITTGLAGPLERRAGASGYLTAQNLRQQTRQMAGTLMPIIVFTGIATGTLYMQSIENGAPSVAASSITASEARNIETLNFVVVGMIAVFAAVMLINTLIAATIHRRREFGQQRLAGSTPQQVLRMVGLESISLVATGVLFGSIASLFTVIPYSIARTGSIVPDATLAIYLGVVGAAAIVTLASSLGAARHAIRTPAVEAVAA
jgi:ABC-type antimicrobial peptide transport system permease subunit